MSTTETAPRETPRALGVAEALQYLLDKIDELEQRVATLEGTS